MQFFWHTPSTLLGGTINEATSAKEADECNQILGQELYSAEEKLYSKDAHVAKIRELDAWSLFKVHSLIEPGKCDGAVVGNRWVLTWKMVDGVKTVKVRLVTKGYKGPNLTGGLVET